MSNPTRFLSGVATVPAAQPLGNYPFPDPFHTGGVAGLDVFTYSTDYTDLGQVAANTVTGSSSTFALEAGIGGYAVLTPGASTTASSVYRTNSNFQFVSGQKFWFLERIIPGLFATTGTYAFGLQFGSATTDGIWFTKPASSTEIRLVSSVNSTATTLLGTGGTVSTTPVATHITGSLTGGVTTSGSTTITYTASTSLVVGQYIYGTGIPLNSTVTSIISSTSATISAPASASGSSLTFTYATALDLALYYNGTDLLVYKSDNLVARIPNITIGSTNTFTVTNQLLGPFVSCTPTATDLLHVDYVLAAQETTR